MINVQLEKNRDKKKQETKSVSEQFICDAHLLHRLGHVLHGVPHTAKATRTRKTKTLNCKRKRFYDYTRTYDI